MNDQENKKDSPKGKFVYVIKGDPTSIGNWKYNGSQSHHKMKSAFLYDTISLESQHENRKVLTNKPLGLYITLYYPIPLRSTNKQKDKKKDDFFTLPPSTSNCIKYIELIAAEKIYNNPAIISLIHAEKRYDENPRTEFYFVEL